MIRLLVTGFGPFPGAPVNPTEALMRRLRAAPPRFARKVALSIEVVATEYAGLRPALERLGGELRPDIAVHFGLAGKAAGLRLETQARNVIAVDRPDAAGFCPADGAIVPGGSDHASTLPLAAIGAALAEAGIGLEPSDDCGDYLCNAIFYHAVSGIVPGYRPAMAGFVHVPPDEVLPPDELERAARIILAVAVDRFAAEQPTRAAINPD